ncbi:MAG: hypothetical protein E6G97_10320 [Alphaproteobacteria bacterium]|nr:MAG: hypothetical protein E6G97_10320 [Alphaproteobacteria bacterium]
MTEKPLGLLIGRARELFRDPPVSLGIDQCRRPCRPEESPMNGIIYLVGLIVVVLAILSFLGLR